MAQRNIGRLATAVRDARGRIVKPANGDAGDAGTDATDGGTDGSTDSGGVDAGTSPEPVDPGTGFDAAPIRRGPGRPRKSSGAQPARAARKTSKEVAVTSGSLTDTLVEIHAFLADLTEIRRFELERNNAAQLARALNNANQHVKIPMLNSRNAALLMLAWTAGRIYLPMARDVMKELQTPRGAGVAQAETQAERMRSGSASGSVVPMQPVAGSVVPVTTDDAALGEWLPTVAN